MLEEVLGFGGKCYQMGIKILQKGWKVVLKWEESCPTCF